MSADLQTQAKSLPRKPGCYLFKNQKAEVLYVGKAKDLQKRTLQYFGHDTRIQLPYLINEATSLDYIVTTTELEALFLENTLIKKYHPKYNINLKDDKAYAFIKIDYQTEIPQIIWARNTENNSVKQPLPRLPEPFTGGQAGPLPRRRGNKTPVLMPKATSYKLQATSYFGPYSSTQKIRQTLDLARKIFSFCGNTEVGKRPCFYYHLHRCPGVCVGAISIDEYKIHLEKIKLFLKGQTNVVYKELAVEMKKAASKKQFEKAARLRDQIKALGLLNQRQTVQFTQKVNWDFWSTEAQNDIACVNLLKIREGKLIDSENFIVHGYTDFTDNADAQNKKLATRLPAVASNSQLATFTIQSFLEQYYIDTTDLPRAIFTQTQIENAKLIEDLLKTKIDWSIKIITPSKGKKAQLISLSQTNAKEGLRKYLQNNAADKTKIQEALTKLQQILKLPALPHRIECYDISNTQGTNPVGSMVVFINGEPAKSEYRKFKIRIKDTPDDFSMMREMLTRRLAHSSVIPTEGFAEWRDPSLVKVSLNKSTRRLSRDDKQRIQNKNLQLANLQLTTSPLWPPPDLIVIDGGKGQLSVAQEVLHNFKLQISNFKSKTKIQNSKTYNLPTYNLQLTSIIGLAKRIEEIFVPHKSKPIILEHSDPTLQLLQRLRDEAHRFAITFHRSLRSKQAIKSELDEIKGVGPKTKKLLKQHFGTVKEIKKASLDELAQVVGNSKAKIIKYDTF